MVDRFFDQVTPNSTERIDPNIRQLTDRLIPAVSRFLREDPDGGIPVVVEMATSYGWKVLPSPKRDTYFTLTHGKKIFVEKDVPSDYALWHLGHELMVGEVVSLIVSRTRNKKERIAFIADHLPWLAEIDVELAQFMRDSRYKAHALRERQMYLEQKSDLQRNLTDAETLLNKKTPMGFTI